MDVKRVVDTLTAGPARRRRRMSGALRELDRADAARQRGGGPLAQHGGLPAPVPSARRMRVVTVSPVFGLVAALTAAGGVVAWTQGPGTLTSRLGVFVMVVAGWVVSLSLHEFAHAYTGYRAGDQEARTAGYLTLNPLRYAHPVLSLLLPLLFIAMGGIGLPGGAVALHPHRFASRAWRSAVSAAGPAANLLVAAVTLTLVGAQGEAATHLTFWSGLAFLGYLQLSVAVLNLLPIPGLDGWGILEPYVRPQTAAAADKVKPWGMFALFALLMTPQVGAAFGSVVSGLAASAGVPAALWQVGGALFRFWQ